MLRQILTGLVFISILSNSSPHAAMETCALNGAPNELIRGAATAYCLDGTMANGEQTHEGACASSKDRMGCVLVVYQRLPDDSIGDLIGIYTVEDQGGTDAIRRGDVIDVWQPDMEACQEFMDAVYADGCKGKVWIQVIKGVG